MGADILKRGNNSLNYLTKNKTRNTRALMCIAPKTNLLIKLYSHCLTNTCTYWNHSYIYEEQWISVNLIPKFVMEKFNKDNCELIESSWYARAFMTIYLYKRWSGKIERKTTLIVQIICSFPCQWYITNDNRIHSTVFLIVLLRYW